MPGWWMRFQNRFVSWLIFRIWGGKRRSVQNNLSVILGREPGHPDVVRLARRTFENYGHYLMHYVQIYRLRKSAPSFLIPEERGSRHVVKALSEGNGAILITPHLGNWELGGVTFALKGHPIHALTLRDHQTDVQDFRDRMRGTLGIMSVHLDPHQYGTVLKLVKLLNDNQVIAMLGDRWEGGKKLKVNFFGKKVYFPAGAPALALASGAPIIPVFTVLRPNGRYLAWMETPIHVKRCPGKSTSQLMDEKTQEIAAVFERVIARYPDQWYHFFDYWKRYAA